MELGYLFHRIPLTIPLVPSECFAINVYLMALLPGIKLVLLQKVFINVLAWTITTPLVQMSSPPLYASFSILWQAEARRFNNLISIIHFCKVHYLRMFICLNLLALLIGTPFTFYANSVRPFMTSSKPPMISTMSYIST